MYIVKFYRTSPFFISPWNYFLKNQKFLGIDFLLKIYVHVLVTFVFIFIAVGDSGRRDDTLISSSSNRVLRFFFFDRKGCLLMTVFSTPNKYRTCVLPSQESQWFVVFTKQGDDFRLFIFNTAFFSISNFWYLIVTQIYCYKKSSLNIN